MIFLKGKMLNIKKCQSVIEYSIVIGTIALALAAMQIYFKRAVQGHIKGLADRITSEHYEASSTNATYSTSSSEFVETENYEGQVGKQVSRYGFERTGIQRVNPKTIESIIEGP